MPRESTGWLRYVALLGLLLGGCAEGSLSSSQPGDRPTCTSSEDCASGVCADGLCVVPEDVSEPDAATDVVEDATDVSTDVPTDVPPADAADPVLGCGELDHPCSANRECCSGYCIDSDEGRICTEICAEEHHCPEGWECRLLRGSEPDVVRLCVPPRDILCEPCTNHSQCGGLGDFCLEQADGHFCATDCSRTGVCPDGFACSLHWMQAGGPDGEDIHVELCEPLTGVCEDLVCEDGLANCDGDFGTGCETDLWRPEACGTGCAGRVDCTALANVDVASCPGGSCRIEACETGYGNCDENVATGCETDLDVPSACGTSCDSRVSCLDGDACTRELCVEGACDNSPICPGTAESCGCESCVDCTAQDGWYDDGASTTCCDGNASCTSCQDQELRAYACDGTTCTYDVVGTRTLTDGCTVCDDADACTTSVCEGAGVCSHAAVCDGSAADCGCSSCTDCTVSNGWYDDGASTACCDGSASCSCQDQEYRSYSCSGTSCTYAVTNTRTQLSGCSTCNDGNACTQNFCSSGSCSHPAYCSGTNTSCGCTSCTNCTQLDNASSTSCVGGSCVINSCSSGYANCDGLVSNGCELNLNTCASSGCCNHTSLGGSQADKGHWTLETAVSGRGERCYSYQFQEKSDAIRDLAGQFVLSVPSGVDYDIHVTGGFDGCERWTADGWVSGCSGIRGTGLTESVWFWRDERWGSDDTFTATVEIRFFSGSSCSNWQLEVWAW